MPRPKEFDPEAILDQAVDVFWARGYEGTSIQDLVDALGINRSSLYATFGDKHDLYLAALQRYGQNALGRVAKTLNGPGPVHQAINDLFDAAVIPVEQNEDRRGCLICNAAVEQAPRDPAVEAEVKADFKFIEDGFAKALDRAKAADEIDARSDATAIAKYLTSNYMGLRVMAKAGHDPASLRDVANVTLSILGKGVSG